ncbi:MFS transporter [Streptosporangium sp. NPDC023615]|uniref:MFS transporter n=1 Tax=Streptosporangium sp. NPDC023615 TaxID=3154794 RepID=UPI00341389AB
MRRVPLIYLASYVLSLLGNSIAAVALPLIVLQTTGSVLSAGILSAATAVPAFAAGLVMGVVIDRINRRTSSVITDLISAASLAALPVVDLVTGLNLGWFILFGVVGAIGDVPGMTAREALLPAIVRVGGVSAERLMGVRESLGALVMVIGPAAAGSLLVLFDGSMVLWITAGTSSAAAMLTLLIPRDMGAIPAGTGSAPSSGREQLREGWRVLFRRDRFLLTVTMLNLVMVAVIVALQGIVLPAHFTLIDRPEMLGFVLTAMAAGTLVGSGLYAALGTRGPRRAWFTTGMLGTAVGVGVISALPSMWVVFAGAFALGFSSGLFGSLLGVLMIERIPDGVLGRVMGTQNSLMMITGPVGILAAALIAQFGGLTAAGATMGVVWAVAVLVALRAPALRNLDRRNGQGVRGTDEVDDVPGTGDARDTGREMTGHAQ